MLSTRAIITLSILFLAAMPLAASQQANTTNQTSTNATNLTENESAFTLNRTTNATVEQDVTVNVSTVIVASTENYPDALAASAAASKVGAPVLLTENDTLSQDMTDTIDAFNPDEVVLVGGPAVLSPEISTQLEEDYTVTRLWGFTRYGTSVEVAEYFWPEGADTAVLVQNQRQSPDFQPLAAATDLATAQEAPLYLTPPDTVPAITASSLAHIGANPVTVVGTNVSDQYESQLDAVNVTVNETITANTTEQLQEQLQNRTRDRLSQTQQLVVVASDDYRHALVAAGAPNATVRHVTQSDDIQPLVDDLNESTVENATVVGSEQLGQSTAVRLAENNISVTTILGPAEAAPRLSSRFALQHAETFAALSDAWMDRRDRLTQEREARISQHVAGRLVQTERLVDDDAPDAANESLQRAAQLYQDTEYASALQQAMQARNIVRMQQYQEIVGTAELEAAIRNELLSLEQFRRQIQTVNPRFGAAFAEAPTGTQLWIIESVRDIPEQEAQQIFNETASTFEEEEDLLPQFEQARDRVEAGNITANRTNATQPGTNLTNVTNATGGNQTGIANVTNQTNTTNETTLGENESRRIETVAGERFDYDTRCLAGNASRNSSVTIASSTVHNTITVNGSVLLPTPNFNATGNVSINESGQTADIQVNFTERPGVGLQCLGEGKFIQEINVSDGEWQVNVTATVGNETVAQQSGTVQVPAQTGNETTGNATNATDENQTETGQRTIVLTDNAFQPAQISAEQGDTLVFRNDGENRHNVNIPGLGVDQDVPPGEQITVELDETGTFDLACSYHEPEMTGEITVT